MGNKNWMYYAAYGVLVVGAGTALILSQRPLSSTVVTLVLFSFNLAAIIFLLPNLLGFIGQLRAQATANTDDLREQLATVQKQLADFQKNYESRENELITPAQVKQDEKIPLGMALRETKANTTLTIDNIQLNKPAAVVPAKSSTPSSILSASNATPMSPVIKPMPIIVPVSAPVLNNIEKPLQTDLFNTPVHAANTNSSEAPAARVEINPPLPAEMPTPTAPVNTDAKLVAVSAVGDDDVLCIRGEGPGLNWQEGIPMNYEGADRWSWKAEGISSPITCRIYLNDEISAFGDDIELQPGQTAEVSPSFPKVEA